MLKRRLLKEKGKLVYGIIEFWYEFLKVSNYF